MKNLYMLDTDMASYVIRGTSTELLERFSVYIKQLCISSITVAELQFGVERKKSPLLTEKVHAFCELVPAKPFGFAAAQRYGKLRAVLEKRGTPLACMDLLIAASALAENAVLVTNNTEHFCKVPSLPLANWLKS